MSRRNTDEPRDEFDHIELPGFVTRPIEFLQRGPARPQDPAATATRNDTGDSSPVDGPGTDDETPRPPVKWWASPRGRTILYVGGTAILFLVQLRGTAG